MKFLLFCILSMTLPMVSSSAHANAKSFEVQGHRGARWFRPENTLSAFRYAVEVGADTLEMDIHVTKDDVLVITHDPFLNPLICLDPNGQKIKKPVMVRNLTLKELQSYDCGSLINPRFPEQVVQPKEQIPTFDALLTWLDNAPDPHARKIMLNVETKSEEAHPEYTPEPVAFTKMIISAMKKHKIMDRCILQSFDYRTLVAARSMEPNLQISVLVEGRPQESLGQLALRYKANIISPNFEWIIKSDIDELHKMGVRMIPWTPNRPSEWDKLVKMGVDGIISDNPKALLAFRNSLK